jgi:hypothetical protein
VYLPTRFLLALAALLAGAALAAAGVFLAVRVAHVRLRWPPWPADAGAAAVTGAYCWSLVRHPWRRCLRCGGNGRHVDTTIWKGKFGRCTCCGGTGKHLRWGVRLLRRGNPGRYG